MITEVDVKQTLRKQAYFFRYEFLLSKLMNNEMNVQVCDATKAK